jgi:hypothetical protein
LNLDFEKFCKELEILIKYFEQLFDEDGNCIDETGLSDLRTEYPEIYQKYFS